MLLQANKHSLLYGRNEVCTVLFLMALVWSQRAVYTVLFLMAELYRCPSAVDDVREGAIVRGGSALPSICMGCTIYCLSCAIIRKTHLLRTNCPESISLAESRPPPVLSLRPFPSWFCSHVRACRGWKCSAVESSLNAGWVKPCGLLFARRARREVGVGRYKQKQNK